MGTADRIERDKLAKRTAILDAARELFLERGVDAVTLREVAQKVEYSTTAIYVHFKDKQDLIEQMVREDFGKFAGALLAMKDIPDPLDRLVELGKAYLGFALSMPRHYTLLFLTPRTESFDSKKSDDDAGIDGFDLLKDTVAQLIAQGRLRPEYADANGIALGIWSAVHGLVSLLITKGDHPHFQWAEPAELLRLTTEPMLRGLLLDPDAHFAPPKKKKRK
jgi:AcrR family transcriptional regulator